MGAKKGNKNGRGNHNSGRKSAYQERMDAEFLIKLFSKDSNIRTISKKIATGKYSIKDVFISKAMSGNERFVSDMFKKIFPDNINLNSNAKVLFELEDETREILEAIHKNNVSKRSNTKTRKK